MIQNKFVFRQLIRYIYVCTRRIQFPLQNIQVVSFSDNDDIICCIVSRGRHIYCVISLFSCSVPERLGDCLYKCGCVLKVSILTSTMRKNAFFQLLRACTQKQNHPSCSMPHALIKTTYNAYLSISHFTDSLTSLST